MDMDESLGSDSKKRTSMESGFKSELNRKRMRMRDLDSVFRSEQEQGIGTHSFQSSHCDKTKDLSQLSENEECSKKDSASMVSNASQEVTTKQSPISQSGNITSVGLHHTDASPSPMDPNTKFHVANSPTSDVRQASLHGSCEVSVFSKDKATEPNPVTSKTIELDRNVGDVSYSTEQNPFHPYKIPGHVKSRSSSECGSSTGPLEENESYRKWNEMKKNGFLSSSHGGIPMPKQQEKKKKPKPAVKKKKKDYVPKKKMEIAKREQVHRFTKIAAPSGLLNGLNPGIINHVRNSKQVHSIIEALVRSKKREDGVQERSAAKKGINERKDTSNMHGSGSHESSHSFENDQENTFLGSEQKRGSSLSSSMHTKPFCSETKGASGGSGIAEKKYHDETSCASHITSDHEAEKLKLKLSSPLTMGLENTSMTNEESAKPANVSSLSIKASTVALQWLELLYQDIKGRLAALRRSRKRVQDVLQTELPFLLLKEFSSTKENDISSSQSSSDRCPNTATPDMHRARWTALFDQMEKALTEEGNHLENWLNQVKEMQLHCEKGLQYVNWHGLQLLGCADDSRYKKENTEKEIAMRAAAASIYSTCNLITAKGDVSCF